MTVKLSSSAKTPQQFQAELVDLLVAKSIAAQMYARMAFDVRTRDHHHRDHLMFTRLAAEIQAIKFVEG